MPSVDDRHDAFAAVAAVTLGLDLGPSRRHDLARAVRAAAEAAPGVDLVSLSRRLADTDPDDPAWSAFASALAVGETSFFRVKGQFEVLQSHVLPDLLHQRRAARRLRLWSAGCATGEEPYSLAMVVEDHVPPEWDVTILATDVDLAALAYAEAGSYGTRSFRGMPDGLLERWFRPAGRRRQIDDRLRSRVRFVPLNLATDPFPLWENGTSRLDLVFCRNVLMYFNEETRRRTTERLVTCLAPGGWLAVAPGEVPGVHADGLDAHYFPKAVFHQRSRTAVVGAPAVPPPRTGERKGIEPPDEPQASPEDLVAAARAAADRGDTPGALDLAAAAVTADVLCAPAHLVSALLLLESGDLTGAEEALRRALFIDPSLAMAHVTAAALHTRRGDSTRAASAARTARGLLSGLEPAAPVPEGGGITAGALLADLSVWEQT